MVKKVLITGASGLLGRAILKEFSNFDGWEALGLAFSRAQGGLRKVDLKNKDEVNYVIQEFQPNVVIHAAAERRPDIVEKNEEESTKLNVTATRIIAEASAKSNAFFLYISTDYVFDGCSPPYKPNDKPNPLNKYGQSKLDGENVTLEFLPNCGVLRVPILYGPVEYLHESAVTGSDKLFYHQFCIIYTIEPAISQNEQTMILYYLQCGMVFRDFVHQLCLLIHF